MLLCHVILLLLLLLLYSYVRIHIYIYIYIYIYVHTYIRNIRSPPGLVKFRGGGSFDSASTAAA